MWGKPVVTVVQGFGPFGAFATNPAELLVRSLAERGDADVVTEVLPVSMRRVAAAVPELMARHRPALWLGVGLAAGRPALSIEAVAVNLAHWPGRDTAQANTAQADTAQADVDLAYKDDDAAYGADVDGVSVTRQPVAGHGPAAHLTTLPVERILRAWREAGIPGYLSQSAGSYLCNFSFYCAAQAAQDLGVACRVGFLHVPLLPHLVTDPQREPSMAMGLQEAGLDAVLRACRGASRPTGLYLGGTSSYSANASGGGQAQFRLRSP
jgi:pyroglutamyl-peptidase